MIQATSKVEFFLPFCIWFNGLARGVCRARIAYSRVREGGPKGPRYPCFVEDRALGRCPKLRYPTRAEAEARARGLPPDEAIAACSAKPEPTAGAGRVRQYRLEDFFS